MGSTEGNLVAAAEVKLQKLGARQLSALAATAVLRSRPY